MPAALGVEVVEGFFNAETAPTLGSFDAVHLNNVLEHIPDPIELLILARECLEPGGILCVNVPNDFSPLQIAATAGQRFEANGGSPRRITSIISISHRSAISSDRLGFSRSPSARPASRWKPSC